MVSLFFWLFLHLSVPMLPMSTANWKICRSCSAHRASGSRFRCCASTTTGFFDCVSRKRQAAGPVTRIGGLESPDRRWRYEPSLVLTLVNVVDAFVPTA
jgi:hypothetical protein